MNLEKKIIKSLIFNANMNASSQPGVQRMTLTMTTIYHNIEFKVNVAPGESKMWFLQVLVIFLNLFALLYTVLSNCIFSLILKALPNYELLIITDLQKKVQITLHSSNIPHCINCKLLNDMTQQYYTSNPMTWQP